VVRGTANCAAMVLVIMTTALLVAGFTPVPVSASARSANDNASSTTTSTAHYPANSNASSTTTSTAHYPANSNASSTTTSTAHYPANSNASSTSTTTPFPNGAQSCSATEWCLANGACHACLTAVLPTFMNGDSSPFATQLEGLFLEALETTPECFPVLLQPVRFVDTLQELVTNKTCDAMAHFNASIAGECQMREYDCFVDQNCRTCLSNLYAPRTHGRGAEGTVFDILDSPECAAAMNILSSVSHQCERFPSCSFYKFECNMTDGCDSCWQSLARGDGKAAAQDCPAGSGPAVSMDFLAGRCMTETSASCAFFTERCNGLSECGECLAEIGTAHGGGGASSIVDGVSTPACANAMSAWR
jgi:hypothetical protein